MTEKRKFGGSQTGSGRKKLGKVKATFSLDESIVEQLPKKYKSRLVNDLLKEHFKTIEDGERDQEK